MSGENNTLISQASGYLLIILGFSSIFISFLYDSLPAGFIGVTFTFFGFLFSFTLKGNYIRSEILNAYAISLLYELNNEIKSKYDTWSAVYLPTIPNKNIYSPRILRKNNSNSAGLLMIYGDDKKINEIIDAIVQNKYSDMHLIPPGNGLFKYYETLLNTKLTSKNLDYVTNDFKHILKNRLNLLDEVTFDVDGNTIKVKIIGAIDEEAIIDESISEIISKVGTPLISSIACVLLAVTQKPIKIINLEKSPDECIVEYEMMDLETS